MNEVQSQPGKTDMIDGPLASWNDTATRAAILDFVDQAVSTGPGRPEERIAVFDNDGTLWTEKPMPVELVFILQRWADGRGRPGARASASHGRPPSRRTTPGSGGAIDKHYAGDDTDVKALMAGVVGAFAGMRSRSTAAGGGVLRGGLHPTLKRPFMALATSRWSSCSATWRRTAS